MTKYLIMDVDGSLTDGKVYMGNNGECMKAFSIKDGYTANYILKPAGIESVVITGRTSRIVENRCKELGITKIYQGITDKLSKLKEVVTNDDLKNCAYFGDDIPDLCCMNSVKAVGGIVGCPADAVPEVKAIADYICINKAGDGALREFTEWLIQPKSRYSETAEKVKMAVEYISALDKENLKPGIYEVDDYFYYLVQEYHTKPIWECVLESHRKYIDIQWIAEGEEAIDVIDIARLQIDKAYSEKKDVMFWKPVQGMMRIYLKAGTYAVLYPENAHMRCISPCNPNQVKKIIGKVRI